MTTLDDLIDAQHGQLLQSTPISTRAALHALADIETSHGERRLASRHERGYCYGSALYTGPNGLDLREQSHVYGCLAHSSWGTWQIMFIAAFEMGFRGDPCALRDDATCLPFVIELINRRILGRYRSMTPAAFADAYNSGNPHDSIVPHDYIAKFVGAYQKRWGQFHAPDVVKT